MSAVHGQFVGADDAVQLCSLRDLHEVAGLVARIGLLVRQRLGDGVGNMLDQPATQHHVQELLAAADAQHRLVLRQRALRHGELEGRAPVLGDHGGVLGPAVIVGRVDIEGAAGHDQRVDTLEIVGDAVRLVRQGDRQAAGGIDGVEIVLAQRIPGKFGVSPWLFRIQGDSDQRARHAAKIRGPAGERYSKAFLPRHRGRCRRHRRRRGHVRQALRGR